MVDLSQFSRFEQGAEAKLYRGKFLGRDCVAKVRFSKSYRHPKLDSKLMKERLKAEVRSLVRCQNIGIKTPMIYLADPEDNVIIMEYLSDTVRCRDYVNDLIAKKDETGLDFLVKEIGRCIGQLHQNNIIHGDLTTSNILIRSDSKIDIFFIDFGLGFAESSSESKGVDLYVLERAFISTHPNTEHHFKALFKAYQTEIKNEKQRKEIIRKYEEVRLRGRKRTMEG